MTSSEQSKTIRLGVLQEKLVDTLSYVKGITAQELAQILSNDIESIQKALRKLRKKGLVTSLSKSLLDAKSHPQQLLWYLDKKNDE